MTGLKIGATLMATSGVGASYLAQIDPSSLIDPAIKVAGFTPMQMISFLCILSICTTVYLVYKIFSLLIPTIIQIRETIAAYSAEIQKCHEKNKNK